MPYDDSDVKKMIKYQTERKVGFSRHKKISPEVKELIHAILEARVDKRYTVDEIKQSVWMLTAASPPTDTSKTPPGVSDPAATNTHSRQTVVNVVDTPLRGSNLFREPKVTVATPSKTIDAAHCHHKHSEVTGAVTVVTPPSNGGTNTPPTGHHDDSTAKRIVIDRFPVSSRDKFRAHGR